MADLLLNEVNADVRAERLQFLWMKYRSRLLIAVVALILGTAANSIWSHYQHKRGGELMQQFRAAERQFEEKNYDAAVAGFATLSKSTDGELNNLAHIWLARALVAAGKPREAVNVLKGASEHGSALWGDIACLRLASLDITAASCLEDKKATPLAMQRTQWAAAHAWAAGDYAAATRLLEGLVQDESSPPATRARMQQWLSAVRAAQQNTVAEEATPHTEKATQ